MSVYRSVDLLIHHVRLYVHLFTNSACPFLFVVLIYSCWMQRLLIGLNFNGLCSIFRGRFVEGEDGIAYKAAVKAHSQLRRKSRPEILSKYRVTFHVFYHIYLIFLLRNS